MVKLKIIQDHLYLCQYKISSKFYETWQFSVCFAALQARQVEMEAARLAREKEEEEAKQAAQQAKKEKEAQKKAIKKERQKLRTTCKVRETPLSAAKSLLGVQAQTRC